jgi:hypothetical protein
LRRLDLFELHVIFKIDSLLVSPDIQLFCLNLLSRMEPWSDNLLCGFRLRHRCLVPLDKKLLLDLTDLRLQDLVPLPMEVEELITCQTLYEFVILVLKVGLGLRMV